MKRVREYEIWNCPARPTLNPDSIVADVANELGFSSKTIIPHHDVPGPVDCQRLKMALAERELSTDDLAGYCSASGYSMNPDDVNVAYHFLNYSYGQCLAWVHLPEENDDDVVRSRIHMAVRRRGFALVDPGNVHCLVFFI